MSDLVEIERCEGRFPSAALSRATTLARAACAMSCAWSASHAGHWRRTARAIVAASATQRESDGAGTSPAAKTSEGYGLPGTLGLDMETRKRISPGVTRTGGSFQAVPSTLRFTYTAAGIALRTFLLLARPLTVNDTATISGLRHHGHGISDSTGMSGASWDGARRREALQAHPLGNLIRARLSLHSFAPGTPTAMASELAGRCAATTLTITIDDEGGATHVELVESGRRSASHSRRLGNERSEALLCSPAYSSCSWASRSIPADQARRWTAVSGKSGWGSLPHWWAPASRRRARRCPRRTNTPANGCGHRMCRRRRYLPAGLLTSSMRTFDGSSTNATRRSLTSRGSPVTCTPFCFSSAIFASISGARQPR